MQMHRRVVLPFAILLAVARLTGEARAQWGIATVPMDTADTDGEAGDRPSRGALPRD